MVKRLFLAALLTLGVVASAGLQAAPVSYGDIEVGIESEPRGQGSHGYTEYRLWVRNRSAERTRQVTLVLPANSMGGPGASGIRSISRSVEVGPGSVVSTALLQPAAPDVAGNGVTVLIDGRRQDEFVPLTLTSGRSGSFSTGRGRHRGVYASHKSPGAPNETFVLLSQRVDERLYAVPPPGRARPGPGMPAPGMPGMGGAAGPGGGNAIHGQAVRADVGVLSWSDRWLAYTRYDAVTLTREDLDELSRGPETSQAIRQALWQYVEAGGVLVVLGPGKVDLPPNRFGDPVEIDGMRLHSVGFGLCVVSPDRDSARWSEDRWAALHRAFSQSGQPWRGSGGLVQNNTTFPVIDDFGVPLRGLFVLMIVFAVVIGPVNLAVLTRRKRRIWLLWTVPVLSLLFCGVVFGYMIVAEGWSGHARVAGLTLLDESARRATTLGKAAFYSPVTPADGLRFSEDTEVQIPGDEHPAFTSGCVLDWTGEQHLSRGWVTARVPSHFLLRKSQALRRERLNLHREADGTLSVTNALGVDIQSLTLADENGQVYRSGPLAAGARGKLDPATSMAVTAGEPQMLRRVFAGNDWIRNLEEAIQRPQTLLVRQSYLAVVETNPFLEQPLRGARLRPSPSVVFGLTAAAAQGVRP